MSAVEGQDILDLLARAEAIQGGQVAVVKDRLPEQVQRMLEQVLAEEKSRNSLSKEAALGNSVYAPENLTFITNAAVDQEGLNISVTDEEMLPNHANVLPLPQLPVPEGSNILPGKVSPPAATLPPPILVSEDKENTPRQQLSFDSLPQQHGRYQEISYQKLLEQMDAIRNRAEEVHQLLDKKLDPKLQQQENLRLSETSVHSSAADESLAREKKAQQEKRETLDVIYRELNRISNELKLRSSNLAEKETRIATQESFLRDRQAKLERDVRERVQAEKEKLERAMRQEYDEQLRQKEAKIKALNKEVKRVQDTVKDLTLSHRTLREKAQKAQDEYEAQCKLYQESQQLFKALKDRNERLRVLLEEKKPQAKVIVKVKRVPVPTPPVKPATLDGITQTVVDAEAENAEKAAAQLQPIAHLVEGLLQLLSYQLQIGRGLAEFACIRETAPPPFPLPSLQGKVVNDVVGVVDLVRMANHAELYEGVCATLPLVVEPKNVLSWSARELYMELVLGFVRHLDHCGSEGKEQQVYLGQLLFTNYMEYKYFGGNLAKRAPPTATITAVKPTPTPPEQVRFRVLMHIVLVHCSPTPAITVAALDMLQQTLDFEETRSVLFAYGGIDSLLRVMESSHDDWSVTVLGIFLDLSVEEGPLNTLARTLLHPDTRFLSTCNTLLHLHQEKPEEKSVEIVERILMLLQRLSTHALFRHHLHTSGDKMLHTLRQLEHQFGDILPESLQNRKKEQGGEEEEDPLAWLETHSQGPLQNMGDRTQAFVLLNIRSILKNVVASESEQE